MTLQTKIAVVVPVYNGENSILKSLRSLQKQTFIDWMAVVVNDGSTDKTKHLLDTFSEKRLMIIDLPENRGRGYARQVALEAVKKMDVPYMCMLDADDWYISNKLQLQYEFMESNPDVSLMSMALGVTNKAGLLTRILTPFKSLTSFYFEDYNLYVPVPHASSIIRVKEIKDVGFNIQLKLTQDQDFMRRLLIGKKYVFQPSMGYIYNREDSFSLKKYKQSSRYALQSFNSLPVSSYDKTRFYIKNRVKVTLVAFAFAVGFGHEYLKSVGRKPSEEELAVYNGEKLLKV